MSISASLVKELRERTQASMMDCKKALVASHGNIDEAIEAMRKSGQAKAEKKSGRTAAEGLVAAVASSDHRHAIIVELNCETDFVAREKQFGQFAKKLAQQGLSLGNKAFEVLSQESDTERLQLVSQLGENVALRRVHYLEVPAPGLIGVYLHGGGEYGARIGVLVQLNKGSLDVARDVAMQVAAMRPEFLSEQDIPAERLAKEEEIYRAELENSQHPKERFAQIIAGKIKKFQAEVTLLDQSFVKDSSKSVRSFLKEMDAEIGAFVRFEVGEGIEKKVDNFVEEVMAQAKGSQ